MLAYVSNSDSTALTPRCGWQVGLTMHTDEFFDRYPEALCSAVNLAFESGLQDSAYQFADHEFQGPPFPPHTPERVARKHNCPFAPPL